MHAFCKNINKLNPSHHQNMANTATKEEDLQWPVSKQWRMGGGGGGLGLQILPPPPRGRKTQKKNHNTTQN